MVIQLFVYKIKQINLIYHQSYSLLIDGITGIHEISLELDLWSQALVPSQWSPATML